jgi:crotonobetainyl-CoA:carnitine CoA-transferase CaiB-like acyl-CoA transferase
MTAPFQGKRVLDLSAFAKQKPHAIATAMASKILASLGAEVHRPLPPQGDPFDDWGPFLPDGQSALARFLLVGRTDSAAIAWQNDANFDAAIGDTACVMNIQARFRLRISVFGTGEDPPMTELGLLALSGVLDAVRAKDGTPYRLAGHQAAYAAGLAAFTTVAAGLRSRCVDLADVSLFDVNCWLNWKAAATVVLFGSAAAQRDREQRSDWRTMQARDGYVALVYMNKDWPALRDLIGDPRLLEPRFATQKSRGEHMQDLNMIMSEWFAQRTRSEITAAAQARRIPIGPVLSPSELLQNPQYKARRFMMPDGTPRIPILWDGVAEPWKTAEGALNG